MKPEAVTGEDKSLLKLCPTEFCDGKTEAGKTVCEEEEKPSAGTIATRTVESDSEDESDYEDEEDDSDDDDDEVLPDSHFELALAKAQKRQDKMVTGKLFSVLQRCTIRPYTLEDYEDDEVEQEEEIQDNGDDSADVEAAPVCN